MGRAEVIFTFAQYEIRRAIARKKVLALVAFTILLTVVPYYALSTAGATLIPNSVYPYIWIAGLFVVGPLFLNFTAILIAAGAMSEEYEQGTAELLLSKPVRRSDYFIGKFLGGYILFLMILALDIFLSIASAFTFFRRPKQFGNNSRALFSSSLRISSFLFSRVHAWGTNQTFLSRIHFLFSSFLHKLHHERILRLNLHANE